MSCFKKLLTLSRVSISANSWRDENDIDSSIDDAGDDDDVNEAYDNDDNDEDDSECDDDDVYLQILMSMSVWLFVWNIIKDRIG